MVLQFSALIGGVLIFTHPQANGEMKSPPPVTPVEPPRVRVKDLRSRVELAGVLGLRQVVSLHPVDHLSEE